VTGRMRVQIFVLVFGTLFIGSCASETANKPETSSKSLASPGQSAPGKSSGSSSQGQTGSSLDAHREGTGLASGPLKEIRFEFNSYDLTSEARSILQANAAWLKANPSVTVEIEGHCDERGTTEYNLALGSKRARAALDYLVSLGIAAARIKTTSYGEELPLCKESSENCYEKNRRDRFVETRGRPASQESYLMSWRFRFARDCLRSRR
jgi:peptidoglycan-associated lipoprotein